MTSWISWKSCQLRTYVTTARPAAANVKAISSAPGRISSAHGEWTRPKAATAAPKTTVTAVPRSSAQTISPRATSRIRRGVARIES